jgi:transmembrane sensor
MYPSEEEMNFCQLVARYLTGIASEAECELLLDRLKEPGKDALFEELRLSWERSSRNRDNGCDVGDISQRVAQAISSETVAEAPEAEPLLPIGFRRWFSGPALAAAASLAIAAISSTLWLRSHAPTSAITQPVVWVQQTCGVSERTQVALDDGTKITLNSGSILSHPKSFGSHNRVVRLTGEAFFDVTHDESRPFIIETPTLRIKVLGTQFNVRAFADGSEAKVSLVKGKVEVSELAPNLSGQADAPKPVYLTPGQQYDFIPETRKAEIKPSSAESATGWMQDRFFWDLEPAAYAMRQLERRFGITVEFSDQELGTLKVSGHFEHKSLEEIFETLRRTRVFDFEIARASDGKIARVMLSPGKLAHLSASAKAATPQD